MGAADTKRGRGVTSRAERPRFTLEFYVDGSGQAPVHRWLRGLPRWKRRAIGAAMLQVLEVYGGEVCGTRLGRHLGRGLFEFRLSGPLPPVAGTRAPDAGARSPLVMRVFCHAHGERIVLLLGGYDTGEDPGRRRQQRKIGVARAHLADWRARQPRSAGGPLP